MLKVRCNEVQKPPTLFKPKREAQGEADSKFYLSLL